MGEALVIIGITRGQPRRPRCPGVTEQRGEVVWTSNFQVASRSARAASWAKVIQGTAGAEEAERSEEGLECCRQRARSGAPMNQGALVRKLHRQQGARLTHRLVVLA